MPLYKLFRQIRRRGAKTDERNDQRRDHGQEQNIFNVGVFSRPYCKGGAEPDADDRYRNPGILHKMFKMVKLVNWPSASVKMF